MVLQDVSTRTSLPTNTYYRFIRTKMDSDALIKFNITYGNYHVLWLSRWLKFKFIFYDSKETSFKTAMHVQTEKTKTKQEKYNNQ